MSPLPDNLTELSRLISCCELCRLSQTRTLAVPGSGDPEAPLVFIGEGPGNHEDKQGLPFVGQAGYMLDQLLAGIGMHRSDVFIGNVVKCRPPGNRDPQPDELEACRPYLDRQVELINPRVIATLGRFAMSAFLGPGLYITRVHGQPHHVGGRIVVPLLHPAAVLRNRALMPDMEADFQRLAQLLSEDGDPRTTDQEITPGPSQMSLL